MKTKTDLRDKIETLMQGYVLDKPYLTHPCIHADSIDSITAEILNLINPTSELNSFIESYLNLFPKGVRSGGKLVKSDKKGTEKKMRTFLKDYPQYSQEIILKVTELYINKFKTKGDYMGMCTAVYLINKQDRGSVLAEECENLGNEMNKPVQQTATYGSKRG